MTVARAFQARQTSRPTRMVLLAEPPAQGCNLTQKCRPAPSCWAPRRPPKPSELRSLRPSATSCLPLQHRPGDLYSPDRARIGTDGQVLVLKNFPLAACCREKVAPGSKPCQPRTSELWQGVEAVGPRPGAAVLLPAHCSRCVNACQTRGDGGCGTKRPQGAGGPASGCPQSHRWRPQGCPQAHRGQPLRVPAGAPVCGGPRSGDGRRGRAGASSARTTPPPGRRAGPRPG